MAAHRDYLNRLRTRMEALKFPADDPLYMSVCRALGEVSNIGVVAASTAT
jgi:hypothetical protein